MDAYLVFVAAYVADYLFTLRLAFEGAGHEANPFASAWNAGNFRGPLLGKLLGVVLMGVFVVLASRAGWVKWARWFVGAFAVLFLALDAYLGVLGMVV